MNEGIKLKKNYNQYSNKADTIDSPVLTSGIPNSVLCDVMSGSKRATSEMMGHKTNLAPSIQAKMSKAFGMDFSNLAIYSSDYMAQTQARGMAQGNKVVLSSDINLNTLEGQAILGHELSHIHAQSMGEGLGHSGLYDNAALEQKADAEGMMAARGMNIFGESSAMSESLGMASFDSLTPIGTGMGATTGAPMQAFLFGNKKTGAQKKLANPDDYFLGTEDTTPPDQELMEEQDLEEALAAQKIIDEENRIRREREKAEPRLDRIKVLNQILEYEKSEEFRNNKEDDKRINKQLYKEKFKKFDGEPDIDLINTVDRNSKKNKNPKKKKIKQRGDNPIVIKTDEFENDTDLIFRVGDFENDMLGKPRYNTNSNVELSNSNNDLSNTNTNLEDEDKKYIKNYLKKNKKYKGHEGALRARISQQYYKNYPGFKALNDELINEIIDRKLKDQL